MTQTITDVIDPAATSGTALATLIDANTASYLTSHSGSARPAYITNGGGLWLDNSDPLFLILNLFDGAADIPLGIFDTANAKFTPSGGGVVELPAAGTNQEISSAAIDDIPLSLKGFLGQTANLFELRDSGGAALAVVDPAGIFRQGAATVRIQKNYIINPTFLVNQRGFVGGALANTVYGFDRWKAGGNSDMSLAGSVLTIASGTAVQVVEDFGYIGPVTVSWTGTSTVNGANASPYTYDKIAGDDTLTFSAGTLSEVKLEVGSVATPLEYPDIGGELSKCQRYYQQSLQGTVNSHIMYSRTGDTSTARALQIYFQVEMRAVPAMSFVSGSNTGALLSAGDTKTSMFAYGDVTTATQTGYVTSWTADSEL